METETKLKMLAESQSLQDCSTKLDLSFKLISEVNTNDRFLDARIYNVLVLLNDINAGIKDRLDFLTDQIKK